MVVGQASTGPLAAPVGRACEAVGACGHDVVVLMQLASDARTYAFECVAPPPHSDATPFEENGGVMALCISFVTHSASKGRCRGKIAETIHALQCCRRIGRCATDKGLWRQRPAGP